MEVRIQGRYIGKIDGTAVFRQGQKLHKLTGQTSRDVDIALSHLLDKDVTVVCHVDNGFWYALGAHPKKED